MRFDSFMRRALYHPEHGYYRKKRDPFGARGDFFTAAQMQPLFGRVIASEAHRLCPGEPVFDLGAGRREMADFFTAPYTGIEIDQELPSRMNGLIFANEFFDALPIRLGTKHNEVLYELLVEGEKNNLIFLRGPELDVDSASYVRRYWPHVADGDRFEIGGQALEWIDLLADRMETGYALFIDYGYTTPETIRFPQGTLMSYQRHAALESVLENPGGQDLTAHVAWDALIDRAVSRGFELVRLETLARLILRNVERNFSLINSSRERQQFKALLFGMGETFRCLLLKKSHPKKNGPDFSGPGC